VRTSTGRKHFENDVRWRESRRGRENRGNQARTCHKMDQHQAVMKVEGKTRNSKRRTCSAVEVASRDPTFLSREV
jgi:hypothetical protein